MKTRLLLIFLLIASSLLQWQCSGSRMDSAIVTQKFISGDPFSQTMVESQFFEIKSEEDNVLAGNQGTHIVIPQNCFLNEKGEPVTGNIKIELAESLDLLSMIKSNLTTTSNGEPIITDGMIYFNATLNGKQLFIDKSKPVYVEIPTSQRKAGMMIYKGERDEKGNINWIEPREPENYLISIDIDLLNFYPEGFEEEVEAGMPFGNHTIATQELKDSLYYSMQSFKPIDFTGERESLNQKEPYYNQNPLNRGPDSYKAAPDAIEMSDSSSRSCGIEPARIKAIKSQKFQNTLISTREFETRLKTIFKTCDDRVLDLYVNHLDKNLWEIDEMASQLLGEKSEYSLAFRKFAEQKLTRVKNEKSAELLRDSYNKELLKIRDELNKLQKRAEDDYKKHEKVTAQLVKEYTAVLKKREASRMVTYGFTMTSTGWVNVDTGVIPKQWGSERLELIVENNIPLDRVYCYVVYPGIKSIYRLNSDDAKNFYAGNSKDKEMLMPKMKPAVVFVVGYKNETSYFSIEKFTTSVDHDLKSLPGETTQKEIAAAMRPYEFSKENSIVVDLEFQGKFYKEKKRIEKLERDQHLLTRLYELVYPCCIGNGTTDGRVLFNSYCAQCHKIDSKLVGPALKGVTSRHSISWLIQWTRDNQELREQGDADAIRIWEEYGKNEEPAFRSFTVNQIKAIYSYIESEEIVLRHPLVP